MVVLSCLVSTGPADARPPSQDDAAVQIEALRLRQEYFLAFERGVTWLDGLVAADADESQMAEALTRVGAVCLEAGDHLAAKVALDTAVEQAEQTKAPRILADALVWQARLLRRLEGTQPCLALLDRAEQVLRDVPDAPRIRARIQQGRANARRVEKEWDDAIELYREALRIRTAALSRPDFDIADNLVWLGWNLYANQRFEEASVVLDEAEAELRALGLEEHSLNASILDLRADAAALRRDLPACEEFSRRYIEIVDRIRSRYPVGYPRSHIARDGDRRLAWVHLQRGEGEKAFAAWETTVAPVTEELAHLREAILAAPASTALALREDYESVQRELRRMAQTPRDLTVRRTATVRTLDTWCRLEARCRELFADGPQRTLTSEALRRQLPARTGFLGLAAFRFGGDPSGSSATARSERWAFLIREDEPLRWIPVWSLGGEEYRELSRRGRHRTQWQERLTSWPTRIGPDPELEQSLRDAAQIHFAPVMGFLDGVDTLVLEGSVHANLIQHCEGAPRNLVSAPSAAMFLRLAERSRAFPDTPAALVISASRPMGSVSLPSEAYEAERLRRVLPGARFLVDDEATESTFVGIARRGELARFDLLHFTCHGVSDPVVEWNALLLNDPEGGPWDGQVDVGEILYAYAPTPPFVGLAACKTADRAGRIRGEYHNLVQAFLASGTNRLLASLSAVDDEATALLTSRFYENLMGVHPDEARVQEKMPAAAALAEAKQWLRNWTDASGRRPFAHPIYWSQMVLYGLP